MNNIPTNCKYTKTHEWARMESDGTVTIGITDHAQDALGDIVFIELPENGKEVSTAKEFGVVESVKSASDIFSPVSGKVVAINDKAVAGPALLNTDPQGEGWLIRVAIKDKNEFDNLMDAKSYEAFLAETLH
jgi:glycine cleavage system H protein